MERSLFHGPQRLLRLLLLFVPLLMLVLLPQTSCQLDEEIECGIERIDVDINLEGCEPARTRVRVCNGACISAVSTILDPPFTQMHCTSCRPTHYSSKPRTLTFNCNGETVTKRMYFPLIKECGCVNTTSSI